MSLFDCSGSLLCCMEEGKMGTESSNGQEEEGKYSELIG